MKPVLLSLLLAPALFAAEPAPPAPAKPLPKIIPGQVIVPTESGTMRRPWGELVSIDLAQRTGTFRNEGDDKVLPFIVMPYAELLHHATLGDLQDFRIGERAIFRLHQNDAGEWLWLTYIQDEMNMMNGHKEFYHVLGVDPGKGTITCDWFTADHALQREKGLVIETNAETKFWKDAKPAQFSDIKVGDDLREQSHGVGEGKHRVAWNVFMDQASLDAFQAEQKKVHLARIKAEGAPAYVDVTEGTKLNLTMFPEGNEVTKELKAGQTVKVAPAGVDRKSTAEPVSATIAESKMVGRNLTLSLTLSAAGAPYQVAGLARVWKE